MESNTDNKEFKEKNREDYKSKGIIAMLLIISIIFTAALGMCSSYRTINKAAKGVKVNYFDEYGFASVIADSSYAFVL